MVTIFLAWVLSYPSPSESVVGNLYTLCPFSLSYLYTTCDHCNIASFNPEAGGCTSEALIQTCQAAAQCHNLEDHTMNLCCNENFKPSSNAVNFRQRCKHNIFPFLVLHFALLLMYLQFSDCPTRCDLFSLLCFCRQLYMFRVLTPIIRSSYNCNCSFWY